MYNGYGQFAGPRVAVRGGYPLFRPLPDPELGDYRGFGDATTAASPEDTAPAVPAPRKLAPGTNPQYVIARQYGFDIGPVGGAAPGGSGIAIVAVAALAAFFFLK